MLVGVVVPVTFPADRLLLAEWVLRGDKSTVTLYLTLFFNEALLFVCVKSTVYVWMVHGGCHSPSLLTASSCLLLAR